MSSGRLTVGTVVRGMVTAVGKVPFSGFIELSISHTGVVRPAHGVQVSCVRLHCMRLPAATETTPLLRPPMMEQLEHRMVDDGHTVGVPLLQFPYLDKEAEPHIPAAYMKVKGCLAVQEVHNAHAGAVQVRLRDGKWMEGVYLCCRRSLSSSSQSHKAAG